MPFGLPKYVHVVVSSLMSEEQILVGGPDCKVNSRVELIRIKVRLVILHANENLQLTDVISKNVQNTNRSRQTFLC